MTGDPHGTWGTWDLDRFEPELEDWRDREHPPADVFAHVDRWWRLLEHPSERADAFLVEQRNSDDSEPDDTDVYGLWVPSSFILDERRGMQRVQCLFRLGEYRVECAGFLSVPWLSVTETDLADGMG